MKKNFYLCIATIIGMMMFATAAYAATYTATDASELKGAMSKATTESNTTIKIAGTFTISNQIQIKDGMNVTLDHSSGSYIRRSTSLKETAPLFYIYSGGTLNLKATSGTFTIKGNSDGGVEASAPLIYVNGGTLNMNSNVVITDCNNISASSTGGAIRVLNSGIFNMNGGSISKNKTTSAKGAGVAITGNSIANLNSGSITDNTSGGNGGGVYVVGSDVNIGNVEINNNAAILGKGLYIADSTDSASNVTLSKTPLISDTIYTASILNIGSSLSSDALFNLVFSNYTIGTKKFTADENVDISTYIDNFKLENTAYCLSIAQDNSLILNKKFKVAFKDYDGATLKSDVVYYDKNATAPENPVRSGYKFVGWDNSYSNIQADVVCTAQYEKLNEIKLYIDGELLADNVFNADEQPHNITAKAYSNNAVLILGTYKNDCLVDIKFSNEDDDNLYLSEIQNTLLAGTTIKAMLWESLESCVPLSGCVEKEAIIGE